MERHLSYTSSEAFQMAKEVFPNTWKMEIDKYKEILLRLKRTYRKDLVQAYQHYINVGARAESSIMMLAALYWILQEEKNYQLDTAQQINDLQDEQMKYVLQAEANESAKNITDFDRRTLRGLYKKKQNELQTRIEELLATFEVVNPVVLTIQTSLFTGL